MQIFINEPPDDKIEEKLNGLFQDALKILQKKLPEYFEKLSDSNNLQVHFISDLEIQELNKIHRGKDSPTDVLSWGYINEYLMPHEDAGEIYISTETAIRKATSKQIPIEDEYMFLFVHGLLHVFDYDHNNDAEESEMNQVTAEILSQYGVDIEPHI
jgi:probable rRNA maturation factor